MIEIAGIERFKMEQIPVTFEHQGKIVYGFLEWCPGAAGFHWDLMVNKFYWGALLYVRNYEWDFHTQKGDMKEYAGYFGSMCLLPGVNKVEGLKCLFFIWKRSVRFYPFMLSLPGLSLSVNTAEPIFHHM